MSELCTLIDRHCRQAMTPTVIPRLTLARASVATGLTAAIYHPLLRVVARGRKRIFLGREEFIYDPDSYLVASVDLPVSRQVLEAPCLGLTLGLEPTALATLLLEMPPASGERAPSKAMAVNPLERLARSARAAAAAPGPAAGNSHPGSGDRKRNPLPSAVRSTRRDASADGAARQPALANQPGHPPDPPALSRKFPSTRWLAPPG